MIDNVIKTLRNLKRESDFSGGMGVVLTPSDISYLLSFAENMRREMEKEKETSRTAGLQNAANETKVTILEKENEAMREEIKQAREFYEVAMKKLDEFNYALERSRKENEELKNRIKNSNHIDRDYAIKQVEAMIKQSRTTESWFFERFREFLVILPSAKDLKESVRCINCEYYQPFSADKCMYKDLCCIQNPEGAISRSVRWCYIPKRGKENEKDV